jgi:HEAT repeat protein
MDNSTEEDGKIVAVLKKQAGLSVDSVFDLVNSKRSYPKAIPILLGFLPNVRDDWIRQGIVRALTVREARGKVDVALVTEFKNIPADDAKRQSLKWVIGNALSVVAGEAVANELLTLAQDKQHGTARQMIVVALSRFPSLKSGKVLVQLLKDEDVRGHAIIALRNLKAHESIPYIEPFLFHENAWIRREAKKALSKLQGKT